MGCSPDAGKRRTLAYLLHARGPRQGVSLDYEEHSAGQPMVGIHGDGSSAAMSADPGPELATPEEANP
jgi:hypothetical protein